jgi:hypothetical protein
VVCLSETEKLSIAEGLGKSKTTVNKVLARHRAGHNEGAEPVAGVDISSGS